MIAEARGDRRSIRRPTSCAHAGGSCSLVERAPFPASARVPDAAIVHERAEHLGDEQRIAFRVPVEERRQLVADVTLVKDGLEPAFELVAR